jgi:hypothetical protein
MKRPFSRGGLRSCWTQRIYFVTIYGKDERDDLDTDQKRQLRSIAEQTRETLRLKQRRKGKA